MSARPSLDVNARVKAGAFALDARFAARPGVTVLFGPTASGKSLTLRLVAGVERLQDGVLGFGDRVLDDAHRTFVAPRDRGLGWAPQDGGLWPHRSALEHLSPFAGPARVAEVLALVDLARHASRRPGNLSGGERQRLAFARAITRSPSLLLLDEPFSALDDAARAKMGVLVRAEADRGAVVLFVTHDRAEAERLGDAFVLFRDGATRESVSLPRPEG